MSETGSINQETEEITFKAIFSFLKKSFWRVVIYVIIAAVLTSVIVLPINFFVARTPVVSTRVQFNFKGIDQGLDPKGVPFNASEMISSTVVAAAIEKSGLSDKLDNVEDVKDHLTIEGVLSNDYRALVERANNGDEAAQIQLWSIEYHPKRYDIKLNKAGELGLNNNQAVKLVSNIVAEYQMFFKNKYATENLFSDASFTSAATNLDYMDYYDVYNAEITNIEDFLYEMKITDSTFRSATTKKSFSDLLTDFTKLNIQYNYFNSYILQNNAWKNVAVAKYRLEKEAETLAIEKKKQEDLVKARQAIVDNYELNSSVILDPNNTTGSTATIVITYPAQYHEAIAKLESAHLALATVTARISEINTRLKYMNESTTIDPLVDASARLQLADIQESSKTYIDLVNATVYDYYQEEFLATSLKTVLPAVSSTIYIDIKLGLIYLAVIALAIITALVITAIKKHRIEINLFKFSSVRGKAEDNQSNNIAVESETTATKDKQ